MVEIIHTCESCGHHADELVIARLILISGKVAYRYLCYECLCKLRLTGWGIVNVKNN